MVFVLVTKSNPEGAAEAEAEGNLGSGIKVCAKGLGSPGASSIRGRPRLRFMIRLGSRFPALEEVLGNAGKGRPGRLRSVGSISLAFFVGVVLLPAPEGMEADDELGVEVAFVTFVDVEVVLGAGIKLVLESLLESFPDVTSAKPLILRFSAVFKSEAN